MKKVFQLVGLILPFLSVRSQELSTRPVPTYYGTDLGMRYTRDASNFRIWSPQADKAELVIYAEGLGGEAIRRVSMKRSDGGTWTASLRGDQKGKFYVFRVSIDGEWRQEVPDPYVKSVGVNGKRGLILDMKKTNPEGWLSDRSPRLKSPTDAIIYEMHIRDASIAVNSGIRNKGKYLGLTETGTMNENGDATGIDHIKEMGVTHVHLLPFFDYLTVDETKLDRPQYNWGYEPLNYNVPEGSYATNPFDGISRIKELKQMVGAFHRQGIGVVMDVVYNHTMLSKDSYFNQLVPDYYYRHNADGTFSNATACGNETASERPMMRKFMIESLLYWVKEYHIDGFRFDLMGVHDIETMNMIARELRKIKPDILLYGEGWTAGASPLPEQQRAVKKNASSLDGIAVFSDDIRDGIKGSVFVNEEKGFASGRTGMEQSIRFGIVAACKHPQVDYSQVNYSTAPYASRPGNTVTYAECHDNHVLWDKLALSAKDATETERKEMYKLALSIVLTSQGISFLHAGCEFLRTKKGNENSYNAGDSINAIDWALKTTNRDIVAYVKGLIKMRKAHPGFRMTTAQQLAERLVFLEGLEPGLVAYTIRTAGLGDSWKMIRVYFNGSAATMPVRLESGPWKLANYGNKWSENGTVGALLQLPPNSCSILYQ